MDWYCLFTMPTTSISQLKINPSAVVAQADDYPIAIKNRANVTGYIIGKDLFETLVKALEDVIDIKAADEADLNDTIDFEEVAEKLGI